MNDIAPPSEISTTLDSAGELVRAVGLLAESRVRQRPSQVAAAAMGLGLLLGLCLAHVMTLMTG